MIDGGEGATFHVMGRGGDSIVGGEIVRGASSCWGKHERARERRSTDRGYILKTYTFII